MLVCLLQVFWYAARTSAPTWELAIEVLAITAAAFALLKVKAALRAAGAE